MTFLDFCPLCGAPAGPRYARSARDKWRGHVQELCVDQTGNLVDSGFVRHPRFPVLHHSCWVVVKKVARLDQYDACWLKEFRDCLRHISPSLQRSHTETAPKLLAEELESILASPLYTIRSTNDASTAPWRECDLQLKLLSLPVELLHVVYSFLTDISDVQNFRTVTGQDPPLATWKSLWWKYNDWEMQPGSGEQFCAAVEHVLQKLEYTSSENTQWPHADTFYTVWENCELVLKFHGQRQYGSSSTHCENQLVSVHASDAKCHNETRRMQEFKFTESSTLTMRFCKVYERCYLCGIEFNGHLVGYKGEYNVTCTLGKWTGLQLVSDGFGFVSFQVRNFSSWQDVDPMRRLHDPGPELRYCEVQWDKESVGRTLVLSLDTFKVTALAIIPSAQSNNSSIMWRTSLPSPELTAVLLLDRLPDKRRCPFWHLENLRGLVSVTAFVNVRDCSVIGFEFRYDDGNVCVIGSPQQSAVRLSHYFTKGEVIVSIGCAEATNNPGIAIKLVTNLFPQGILFGDELAHNWQEVQRPCGVFCASKTRSTILSSFGILGRPWDASVYRTAGTVPLAFPRSTIQTKPPQEAFLANSSLRATTKIIVYSKYYEPGSEMLCGLKLLNSEGSESLLGEDSHENQTIQLSCSIQFISVYYTQCYDTHYLIIGLIFTTSHGDVQVGNCTGKTPDVLEIKQKSARLYCAFNHFYTRIALSEEDACKPTVP